MAFPDPTQPAPAGPLRVLIVEDIAADAMIASAAVARAASGPYLLEQAECLGDALVRLAAADADLVLLDLNLPDSMGLDTLYRIRSVSAGSIIVFTTEDAADIDAAARGEGAFEILHKGRIDVNAVARLLRSAEARRRQ